MQKIENLLNSSYNTFPKFATQKWYVIDSETKGEYSRSNKVFNKVNRIKYLWLFIRIYSSYVSVTGNIAVRRTIAAADDNLVQRKQLFSVAINDTFADYADFINIAMPM